MQNNQKGELLMNMLISIGIIVMILTLSIPYLRQFQPNLKLNSTARDLTSNLRYAQQLTITEQITHMVELDQVNNDYKILKIGAATTTLKIVEFPVEVNYQNINGFTEDQVKFNSYGGAIESGEIILINTNNKTKTINVRPSGYIQLTQ